MVLQDYINGICLLYVIIGGINCIVVFIYIMGYLYYGMSMYCRKNGIVLCGVCIMQQMGLFMVCLNYIVLFWIDYGILGVY